MSNEVEEACSSVLTLLIALSNSEYVVAGYSQVQMAELIYGSQYSWQAKTSREPTGLVGSAIKTLKGEGQIEVFKAATDNCNSYRVRRSVTPEEKNDCLEWLTRVTEEHAERQRAEQERQRRAEVERQRRLEAERTEREREEARVVAERDQFEAQKSIIASRLEEIRPALWEYFNVEVADVEVAFGYPALRAKFTLVTEAATIRACSLFSRRGTKPKAAGPSYKTSAGWNSNVDLAPDLASWLGAALLYALDGGVPPLEIMSPPRA